jgi:CDP-glycerol glycerophosphotransferase
MGMKNNFINLSQAAALNLQHIHFGFTGIGDQILLLAAAEQYLRKTGQKLLIAGQYRDLFLGTNSCWILDAPNSEGIEKLFVQQARAKNNHASNTVVIDGIEFSLKFIPAFDFTINTRGLLGRRWPTKHLLARMCERLGLSGEIEITPRLPLGDEEKYAKRISGKKQIAIMAGGQRQYKSFPLQIAQKIVDVLHSEYDFVQIGSKNDPSLTNVQHLMGEPLHKAAAVLYNSDLFVGSIGGLMHMARAVECPSVIAFAGEPLAYEYYTGNTYVFSDTPCDECPKGRLDAGFDPCPHGYRCVVNINPDKMIAAIREKLASPLGTIPAQAAILTPTPVVGMELWHKFRFMTAQRLMRKNSHEHP